MFARSVTRSLRSACRRLASLDARSVAVKSRYVFDSHPSRFATAFAMARAACYADLAMRFGFQLRAYPLLKFPRKKVHPMKIAISYRHVTLPQPIESVVERQIQQNQRLAEKLCAGSGATPRNPRNKSSSPEFSFSANLSLPTGTLHASAVAPDARSLRAEGSPRTRIADQKTPGAPAQTIRVEAQTRSAPTRGAGLTQRFFVPTIFASAHSSLAVDGCCGEYLRG